MKNGRLERGGEHNLSPQGERQELTNRKLGGREEIFLYLAAED